MITLYQKLRSSAPKMLAQFFENRAGRQLERTKLWVELQDYLRRTHSTGCSYRDYLTLYRYVRDAKPTAVLECGTGVSTLVIACALFENFKETGQRGVVTSMEEISEYYELSRKLLPDYLHPYVDFRLSDTIEEYYGMFRGVRYKDLPSRAYEFVFVDGPDPHSKKDGALLFDADFVHVVAHSNIPVRGIIDMRNSTCFAFHNLFGRRKFAYDYMMKLGFIGPCTKDDILTTPRMNAEQGREHIFRRHLPFRLYPW